MDWLKGLLPFFDSVPAVRAIVAFVLVFFLPGFAWTLLLFRQLKALERIVLSFALSIALVTLSLVAVNLLFGVRITGLNSVLVILVITILPVAAYYLKRIRRRGEERMAEEIDGAG